MDDIEGSLHRVFNPRPNAAYLMDIHGNVAFRSLWSNDERVLRAGLHKLVAHEPLPIGERELRVIPMIKGMGTMYEILTRAGTVAKQDVWHQLPPMYLMARLAARFQPLPPLGRGIAALVTSACGSIMFIAGIRWP